MDILGVFIYEKMKCWTNIFYILDTAFNSLLNIKLSIRWELYIYKSGKYE